VDRFLFTIALMSVTLLQATFFPATAVLYIVPDFALVLLLVWSASRGVEEGLLWAFGLGIWLDFLTLDPLGTHVLPLLAVAVIGGLARGRLFRSGLVLPAVSVIGATIAYRLIEMLVKVFSGRPVELTGEIRLALLAALLNMLLVPLVYGFVLIMDRWIPKRVS
jgi:rod shape-determining protein MreD